MADGLNNHSNFVSCFYQQLYLESYPMYTSSYNLNYIPALILYFLLSLCESWGQCISSPSPGTHGEIVNLFACNSSWTLFNSIFHIPRNKFATGTKLESTQGKILKIFTLTLVSTENVVKRLWELSAVFLVIMQLSDLCRCVLLEYFIIEVVI